MGLYSCGADIPGGWVDIVCPLVAGSCCAPGAVSPALMESSVSVRFLFWAASRRQFWRHDR
jgi:hypothetical protein